MEIKIQLKNNRVLCICIGHVTNWFQQVYFITCTTEYYDDKMNIGWGKYHWGLFREKEK